MELFAGKAGLSKAVAEQGLRAARPMDRQEEDPEECYTASTN